MAVTRIRKKLEQLFIPIQAIQGDYKVLMNNTLQSIIILLTNDLTSLY